MRKARISTSGFWEGSSEIRRVHLKKKHHKNFPKQLLFEVPQEQLPTEGRNPAITQGKQTNCRQLCPRPMEMVTVCLCSHYLFVVTADIYLYALPFFFFPWNQYALSDTFIIFNSLKSVFALEGRIKN